MKILHSSDWHLGYKDNERYFWKDQENFIKEICRIIDEEKVEAVIIAGDVYDRWNVASTAIESYDFAMEEICMKRGIQTLVIAGNHDQAESLSSCSSLLKKSGLHIVGAMSREPKIVSIKDTDFYLMPWFNENKIKSLFPEKSDEIKSMEDAFRVVCDKARETFVKDRRHIAVSHAFLVKGEISDSERAAAIGMAAAVSGEVFEGFDYVALGHLHKPHDIGENMRYSGTPMTYSFGAEEKQIKSVTIIDTDDMSRKIIPVNQLHIWKTIKGTLDEVLKGDFTEEELDGYVKIEITDTYVGSEDTSRLYEKFPNCLFIQGKTFEENGSGVRMTMEEFREIENDPMAIFGSFCKEILDIEPDRHQLELFEEALKEQ